MDVKASVDPSRLPAAVTYEPSPAHELPTTPKFSLFHVDSDSSVGGIHPEMLTRFIGFDVLARLVKLSTASASEESGVLSGSSPEASNTLKGIGESSILDGRFGLNEDGGTRSGREDEGTDIEARRNGADWNANLTGETLDLEKGVSALTPQSHVTGNEVKAVEPGNLDQQSSSGEKTCRVCYLGHAAHPESGPAIELGCDCKDDLAFAHRQCAEAWFKIKGNRTCEICGSTVQNVRGSVDSTFIDNWNDGDRTPESYGAACCQNHRLLNLLLACIVFAFVLPWLFHVSSFFG